MPKKLETNRLIKPREVAVRCGVTPRTVAKWLREGTLTGVKINGHTWRVEEAELEKYIASSRVTPD